MAGVSGRDWVSEVDIIVPNQLTKFTPIHELKLEKLDLSSVKKCKVQMGECTFAEPGPLLFFGAKIRALMKRNPNVKFTLWTRKSQFRGWADHIGFFSFMGFTRGRALGEATGSSNYTPITVYNIANLKKEAGVIPLGKYVSSTIRRLAENLSQQADGPVFDLVEYSIREIARNAAEHSNGSKIVLLGQCWPAKKMAEIIVMDNGLGISSNLYENELLQCDSNREALKFAILPGVTGVSLDERLEQDDHWGNSGFGMFVTSRFCAENGLFRVISGGDGLTLSGNIQTEHPWAFQGTFVQMRLSFADAQSKVDRIEELTESGKKTFGELIKDHPIKASTASKLLASQFSKIPN